MNEKGGSMWLKALAVTSAVALGGGYVAWKDAMAKNARIEALEKRVAEWEDTNQDVTLFVGSKSPGPDVMTFPGSKSAVIMPVEPTEIPGIPSQASQPPLMPGSKSFLVLPPPADDSQSPPVRVLPGSKSLAPIFETPEKEEQP